jgi:hypothetical protein
MVRTFFSGIVVSIITFLTPILGFLSLMGIMIFADTVFAMYVAYTTGEGIKSLTSDKFFNIAPKVFFYLGSIILAFACDYLFVGDGSIFGVTLLGTKAVSFAFIANEVKSMNETYIKKFGKSMYVTIKEYYSTIKNIKKDISDLINTDDNQ